MQSNEKSVATTLKVLYGVVPIVAGLDKFTNLLVDWTKYLPSSVASVLPVSPSTFMAIVGIIEIVAGVIVLSKLTRIGAMIVAAWLVAIAANLILAGYYDIAVRDLGLAVGAWSLSRLWAPAYGPAAKPATVTA